MQGSGVPDAVLGGGFHDAGKWIWSTGLMKWMSEWMSLRREIGYDIGSFSERSL
jgi:hypothetical protein